MKSLFNLESQQSDTNEELLGLCSGQFSGAAASTMPWADGPHSNVSTPDPSVANVNKLVDKLSKLAEARRPSSAAYGLVIQLMICLQQAFKNPIFK